MFYSAFLLWPSQAASIALPLVVIVLVLSIVLIPARYYSAYRRGDASGGQAFSGIVWNILSLVIAFVLISFLGRLAAVYVSRMIGMWLERLATAGAFIAVIIVSLAVVNGVGWVMRKLGSHLMVVGRQ